MLDLDPFSRFASKALGDDTARFLVVQVATGLGKTEAAIRRAVQEAARGAKINYLVPTHKLGAELVARIEGEALQQGTEVSVEVWRGRNRQRPDNPDKTMCSELPTVALAQAAEVDVAAVCEICPAAAECPYRAQQGRRAQIWVGAHDLLWHAMPLPFEGADLVIIDEGFALRGLIGFSGKPQLLTEAELASVPAVDRVGLEADLRSLLMPARRKLIAALRDHPEGGLRRERLIAAGLTLDEVRQARRLEWAAKHNVDIARMPSRRAKQAISKTAERNLLIPRLTALWHAVEDMLPDNGPAMSGRAVVGDHRTEVATFRAVRLFGIEPIGVGWRRTPTLHIDATVDMTLLRSRVPHTELVGHVEAAAPHMRVIQYPDRAFGKLALRNHKFLFEVWDWCIAYAALRGGEWAVIVPKEAEVAILACTPVPDFIRLHHFGALRGLDELRDVRGLIVIGRPMASPGEVERVAGALSGRAVEPIPRDWYPAEVVQLRARDGSMASVEADRHPYPIAEAVRASITEGELLQTIGRARGPNRSAENPVEIVLLTNVRVPGLPLDELRQWAGPTIDDEVFARYGAALESAGDAAKVAGLDREAIKKARTRLGTFPYKRFLYENVPNLCSVIYQLPGPGRSRQRALFDKRRIADCQAWLTNWLGPLAYFAEAEAETAGADDDWLRALETAADAIRVSSLRLIPTSSINPDELSIAVGISRTRHCRWIVDTTAMCSAAAASRS